MHENEIADVILDVAFQIHRRLGPGLLESVYRAIMAFELRKRGLVVLSEEPVPVVWEEVIIDEAFRADLIVESKVVVELKSVEKVHPAHKKQLLTYLRLTKCKLGLLLNFGEELMRNGISRVANGLDS